jgi:hypothetical protein
MGISLGNDRGGMAVRERAVDSEWDRDRDN